MAVDTRKTEVVTTVNGQQARAELKMLEDAAKHYKLEMVEANEAGDIKRFDNAKKSFQETGKEINKVKKSLFDVNTVLNNLSSATPRELQKAMSSLSAELNSGKIARGSKEWDQVQTSMQKVRAEQAKISAESKAGQSMWSKLADGANKYAMVIMTGVAALAGITMKLQEYRKDALDLEDSAANLKSLTGLSDNGVKWLTDQAKQMSTSVTEDGVRITAASKDIVDGFTVIGSKRPELLQNKEALKMVTQEALTLAAAGKMETAPAFAAVTASMNQFNLKAEDSRRIINALAAGSLAGSAEISDLTDSMKNVGTVAKDSNMTLEQSVGALEVLASKQLVGEEAGTKLRGALLKLKEAGVGYTSGQFNMRDALAEVNKKMNEHTSAAAQDALKIRMFGAENVTAGTILLQNIDQYDAMTKACTGTNTAIDQARINTGTMSAKLAQARNEMQLSGMELVEKLSPALFQVTNGTVIFMKMLVQLPQFLKDNWQWFAALTVAVIAYNAAVIKSSTVSALDVAWKKVQELWTNRVTIAQTVLNAVVKKNPIVFMLTVIMALVAGFITWYNHSIKVQAVTQGLFAAIGEMGSRLITFWVGVWKIISGAATFSPDQMKQGIEQLKSSMSKWGDSVADAYQKAYDKRMAQAVKEQPKKAAEQKQEEQKKPTDSPKPVRELTDEEKKKANEATKKLIESDEKAIKAREAALKDADKSLLIDESVYNGRIAQMKQISDEEEAIINRKVKANMMTEKEGAEEKKKAEAENLKYDRDIAAARAELLVTSLKREVEINRLRDDEVLAGKKRTVQQEHELTLKRIEEDRKAEEDALKIKLQLQPEKAKEINEQIELNNQKARTKTVESNASFDDSEKSRKAAALVTDLDNQIAGLNQYDKKVLQLKLKKLKAEEAKELDNVELTEAEKEHIRTKYNQAELELTTLTQEQKMEVIGNTLGAVAGLFKQNTIAYKLVATAQATIDTYLAASKALAAYPPPFGAIAMAGTIATGLANVAKINGIEGLESGGSIDVTRAQDGKPFNAAYDPTKRGYVDKPTVIVGEGKTGQSLEWVASNAAVKNPTVAPIISMIDAAQKNGTIATFDMNRYFSNHVSGYSGGGFISIGGSSAGKSSAGGDLAGGNDELKQLLLQATAIQAALVDKLSQPLQSNVVISGDKGVAKQLDRYNTYISNASR
jgi:TP901 family phage tail tape measure protein